VISCTEATRQLWEYLDNSLAGLDRELVEDHLGLCRQCCGELEFAHLLHDYLTRQPSDDRLPDEVRMRLDQFLQKLRS